MSLRSVSILCLAATLFVAAPIHFTADGPTAGAAQARDANKGHGNDFKGDDRDNPGASKKHGAGESVKDGNSGWGDDKNGNNGGKKKKKK
jgi:hypothetical protein